VLTELGVRLGRYDVGEQAAAIGHAQRRLEEHIRRAEAERDSNAKVHAFLGVAAGLFAIIILL
jgi:stage III sporulation protein AB